jgi:hypothetical protein
MPKSRSKPRGGHYGRYEAFVQGGWSRVLSKSEQAIWHAYEQHADREGVAYPSGETLAELLGHSRDNNIARLRSRLVSLGLLEVLEGGGGRGKPCRVRVLMPPETPSNRDAKTPSALRGIANGNPLKSNQQTPSNRDAKPPQIERALNKEEQPIEQPKEQIMPAAAPRPGAQVASEDAVSDKPAPKGSKFPAGVWERAVEGWENAWRHVHGRDYAWLRHQKGRDFRGLSVALEALGSDLSKLATFIRAYLREPETGRTKGHPLYLLGDDFNAIGSKIEKGQSNGHPQIRAARAGEYGGPVGGGVREL